MNNDLLSRKDLKKRIAAVAKMTESYEQRIVVARCLSIVTDSPAVDAEPVRHGRWDTSFDGITPFCTECGMSHRFMTRITKYCPNCGAKMDGEKEK